MLNIHCLTNIKIIIVIIITTNLCTLHFVAIQMRVFVYKRVDICMNKLSVYDADHIIPFLKIFH